MTDLSKASADAVEAARQGEQFAMMLAAIQAAQTLHPQQPPPTPAVAPQHSSTDAAGTAGKWLAIGIGGSMLMITVAFAAVALAIAAACIALVALVVYGIYRDIRSR